MLQRLNPASAPAPFSRYSQAVIAPQGYRWLHVSGQVGCDKNGKAVAITANSPLELAGTVKTYRYLDEEEVAEQEKAAQAAQGGNAAGKQGGT